jgi:hypothetical protein
VSQINPFTGSILQATNVQRTQAAEKDRAIQKARDRQKNSALGREQLEHQVESSEAVTRANEDEDTQDPRKRKQKKGKGSDSPKPQIDLRA